MGILDKFSLAGKVAPVTGAASGLGASMVRAMAEAGALVAGHCRTPGQARDTCAAIDSPTVEVPATWPIKMPRNA